MKNNTNIYDIDGEIIRKAGDGHKFTADEVKEMIDKYYEKLSEISKIEYPTPEQFIQKRSYAIYILNLTNHLQMLIMRMSEEERKEFYGRMLPKTPKKTTAEQVEEAVKELRQEDMMVERDTEPPVMDQEAEIIEES